MRDLGELGGGSAASATLPSRSEIEAFTARLADSTTKDRLTTLLFLRHPEPEK